MTWIVEKEGGFVYVTRSSDSRVQSTFLSPTIETAKASADALNLIERGEFVTCAPTSATRMLHIPRLTEGL